MSEYFYNPTRFMIQGRRSLGSDVYRHLVTSLWPGAVFSDACVSVRSSSCLVRVDGAPPRPGRRAERLMKCILLCEL